jgi:uncharacterized protein YegL
VKRTLLDRVRAATLPLCAALSLLATACGGGLNVTLVNAQARKPNNVWVFFTVDRGKKDPVGGLAASDFKIYQDGHLISEFESKQTIQNPEVAAVMYTMLLVDMSGSITGAGQADSLVDAAKSFSDRVGKTQKVGVYAFDGEAKIHSVVPFTETSGQVQGGLEGLRKYKPKDPSTNLHGAVVEALRELHGSLEKDRKPLKFGTLVLFTDGTDQAHRATREDMKKELGDDKYKDYEMFAIGVGAEIDKGLLGDVGRDGTELASDQNKVKEAFDKMAARIEAHTKRFYLLSYCTPARQGDHDVTVEAHTKNPDGSGALQYKFSAKDFGSECDPKTPPSFDLKTVGSATEDAPAGKPAPKK